MIFRNEPFLKISLAVLNGELSEVYRFVIIMRKIIRSLLGQYRSCNGIRRMLSHGKSVEKLEEIEKDVGTDMTFGETNRFSTTVRRKLRKINDTPLKSRVETGDIYVSPLYRSKDINYTFFSPLFTIFLHHSPPRFRKSFLVINRNCKNSFYCVKVKTMGRKIFFSINYSPRSPRFARLLAT